MSASSASFSAAAEDNYRKATDSYRSVAKWVVSSFGAIAAALVVGLPLTSLGELSGWRLVAAIACVAIVFLAILIVIRTASEVLEPLPPVDRTDLAKKNFPFFEPLHEFLADNQSMLGWEDVETAAELNAKYNRRWDAQVAAEATLAGTQKKGSKKQIKENKKAVDDAAEAAEEVRERLDLLATFGGALYMKKLYRQAMNKAYAAIAVSAALAICFACLSSSADADSGKEANASTPAPIHVTVVTRALEFLGPQ